MLTENVWKKILFIYTLLKTGKFNKLVFTGWHYLSIVSLLVLIRLGLTFSIQVDQFLFGLIRIFTLSIGKQFSIFNMGPIKNYVSSKIKAKF